MGETWTIAAMIVKARRDNMADAPSFLLSIGITRESRPKITISKEYMVYGISLFNGVAFFCIVNDVEFHSWLPAWLFDITDNPIDDDWVCSMAQEDNLLVLGPAFMANSIDKYEHMLEGYPESRAAFWKRVEEKSRSRAEDSDDEFM